MLSLAVSLLAPASAGAQTQTVRVALNQSTYSNLPFFLAADKGYFRDAGLDVQIIGFNGSSTLQIPRLARGDVDVMGTALGPAFFNQFAGGFNIKLLATVSAERAGWSDTTWLLVRQDLWDARAIRNYADLRGKRIDGAAPGSPVDFLALSAIEHGGLGTSDVQFSEKLHDAPTWLGALRNGSVDVLGIPEPVATQMQVLKVAHKWVGMSTLAPWYNEEFLAASESFTRDRHDVAVRFLQAYLRAVRDIRRSNGRWTPELVATTAKWTALPAEMIRQIPGPAYPGDGDIDDASVAHQQDVWHQRGLVAVETPPAAFIDAVSVQEAIRATRAHL
jgi:NitT/TauT family transport system substrate-binding protein